MVFWNARNGENIQTTLFILSTQCIVMILPATVFAVQPRSTYFSVVVQPRKRRKKQEKKGKKTDGGAFIC